MSPKPLAGQTALVTGANSGIGLACAVELGRAGADVVVNYLEDRDSAAEVVAQIQGLGVQAYAHRADISRPASVRSLFERMRERFGGIDILVNNAGIQRDAPIARMSPAQWDEVLAVNLRGQFLCAQAAVRDFRRRATRRKVSRAAGKIIFISSVHEVIPWAGHVNYAASKGGLMLLMKSLAQEVAPERIRVNGVAPGAICTDINRPAWRTPAARRKLLRMIPYKRIGEPVDIARAVVWLASDDSDYVTGTSLFVDGGMTLYPDSAAER